MTAIKKVGILSFILIILIALVIDGLWVYYEYFDPNITVGINNVGDQLALDIKNIEDLTELEQNEYAERWFFEANYYSNDAENGIEVQELNLNYFMDWTLLFNTYRSTGMQYKGDYSSKTNAVWSDVDQHVVKDLYYYDTTNGISWSGKNLSTLLNRDQTFVIKIDNRAFQIQLTGKEVLDLWIVKLDLLSYNYGDLFEDTFTAIESNSEGYGSYYITLDLSKYFTIREYDESGKFLTDDVTDVIKNYAVMKFNYYENGLINANQSKFGQIALDRTYGLEDGVNTDYWQARVNYTLDESLLSLRYSSTYSGYFASISPKLKTELNSKNANVFITLNLTDKNIVGFDYNGFEGLKINTITLTSDETQDFRFLSKSLKDTQLKFLKHSASVNLIFDTASTNSAFTEVII